MITVSKAKVDKIIEHKDDLREYFLIPDKYRSFRAGMFLQLSLDLVTASDCWPESRTFSIASAHDKSNPCFRLIIRRVGKYTSRIFNELKVGSICTVKYPFGDLMLPGDDTSEIICIAGGSGIAPFLSFLDECARNNTLNNMYVFYSAKTESEMLYKKLLSELLGNSYYPFVTREKVEWAKNRRISIDDVIKLTQDSKLNTQHYYICGSPSFIDYFKKGLRNSGKANVFTDEWE
ncbi:MAG TPA: hypothetical protein DD381_08860 [Lentisphaeria bacterium]|nr:MAG: hypothetical protein A2X47_07995 [Lentisphaerae bacterium GWF2_38_69]HBM16433.1 hypothetical protein [Lentisphaeria bacterium]